MRRANRFGSPIKIPEIDVAVISINGQQLRKDGIRFACFLNDETVMPRSKAIEKGVSEGDGIFVLGFPFGLVGKGIIFEENSSLASVFPVDYIEELVAKASARKAEPAPA